MFPCRTLPGESFRCISGSSALRDERSYIMFRGHLDYCYNIFGMPRVQHCSGQNEGLKLAPFALDLIGQLAQKSAESNERLTQP